MMNGSGLELQAVARADDTRAGAKYARWLDARPRITSTRSVLSAGIRRMGKRRCVFRKQRIPAKFCVPLFPLRQLS